ncbi:MAG: LL-diaminopimelate aminotransferase [Limnothrix sp. CACIAM 69d]|nr:MAG: LL-diaminopimelate aminotransferase [Limnothrix sp. CACIAM 69d]
MQFADRLKPLQFNVFAAMDRAKAAAAETHEIVDLSLGSVDLPTSPHVLSAIGEALQDPSTHGYQLFRNTAAFRQAAADRYERQFGLAIDPETEVLALIGSQEGTAHLPLAVLNPGDVALLGDPGYPSHYGGVHLAGGEVYPMPLLAKHGYLPQLEQIPPAVVDRARLMVLNYPHNPTTAVADLAFFRRAVAFCQQHGIVLIHDFAYDGMAFGDHPPSVLQADPDKTVSIEFFTLSKAFNMGGFRAGYAIGNRDLIAALRSVKAAVDFNQYQGIFRGAIAALQGPQADVQERLAIFRDRRDAFVAAMNRIGWPLETPQATMFAWAKLPPPWENQSIEFCKQLVAATGIAVAPGVGFGPSGEGYVRFALVQTPEQLAHSVDRIAAFLQTGLPADHKDQDLLSLPGIQ